LGRPEISMSIYLSVRLSRPEISMSIYLSVRLGRPEISMSIYLSVRLGRPEKIYLSICQIGSTRKDISIYLSD